jgi:general secretion pathway protein D
MKKFRWVVSLFIIAFLCAGCATLSEDMRLSNEGLDEISKGNYQEAEKYLERALSINPNNPYAVLNMGVVYHNTKRKEQARGMYRKVISLTRDEKAQQSNEGWALGKELVEIAKKNLEIQ